MSDVRMDDRDDGIPPTIPVAVVKEEPLDPTNHDDSIQVAMAIEEDSEGRICTPESQENEVRTFLTKCIFCSKNFNPEDEAKLLECLHVACSTCISSKLSDHNEYVDPDVVLEGNVIICQVCNVESQIENLIDNRFHTKLAEDESQHDEEGKEEEEEKKCTSCHDNANATSWCVDCEEFICQNCVNAHQRLKITKDHTIKPKNEVLNETENSEKDKKIASSYLLCPLHHGERLGLFCEICDRLTCRDCQLTEHRDHKYKFTHEIAAETRSSVTRLLKEVSYKRVLLKSAMKVIEDRQVLIVEKKKSLVQDITQMVIQLTNAINTRGKQLVMRLNEVCDQKQNTLNEKRIALDQLSKLTDHCIQFVTYALDKGSDMELLYSKKSVTGHLQRIKNRRADIPNPEIPVRIHLSLEKVQDLIKVVSSIGAIVVDGRVYPAASPSSRTSTPTTPSLETQDNSKLPSPARSAPQSPIVPPVTQQIPVPQVNSFPPVQMTFAGPQVQQSPQVNHVQLPSAPVQPQNFLPHYSVHTMPPRSSPQAQQPRMPYNINFNGTTIRQQLMMTQRPMGLSQQQVTSSTHPQQQIHLEQLNQNPSLRGLLAPFQRPMGNQVTYRLPPGYRYPAGTNPIRTTVPHIYQPTNPALVSGGRVQQIPQGQMSNFPMQQQTTARWHIPQGQNTSMTFYPARQQQVQPPVQVPAVATPNDAYKIMLKSQGTGMSKNNSGGGTVGTEATPGSIGPAAGQTVSSSVPKTPSPIPGKSDETEKSLDKFCQKSLNDLMLTIAKLDSNGIVVIPEAQKNQLDSSQVDSSTDEGIDNIGENSGESLKNNPIAMTKDDPNEDWCAVCMDGGDAVLCCDKCPKVFHLYCHIPSLKTFPDESETWQCMLCTNVLDCSDDPPPSEKRSQTMSPKELRIAQRIVLELYCQYEQSLPFREIVSSEITEYHKVIKKPIALDVIREKLKPDNPNPYTDLRQVMADIRLMFKNAFTFNPVDSQVYFEARNLEEFFEKLLLKWAPNYAFDDPFLTAEAEEEEEVFPPNRKYRRIISD